MYRVPHRRYSTVGCCEQRSAEVYTLKYTGSEQAPYASVCNFVVVFIVVFRIFRIFHSFCFVFPACPLFCFAHVHRNSKKKRYTTTGKTASCSIGRAIMPLSRKTPCTTIWTPGFPCTKAPAALSPKTR